MINHTARIETLDNLYKAYSESVTTDNHKVDTKKKIISLLADWMQIQDDRKEITNYLQNMVFDRNPSIPHFHISLSKIFTDTHRYISALEVINDGIASFPSLPLFTISKARICINTGDYTFAIEILEQCKSEGVTHPQVDYLLRKASLLKNHTTYRKDGLITQHSHSFQEDQQFLKCYDRGLKATNNKDYKWQWRVHVGLWVAHAASSLQGDFVECGVNEGFLSSAIMTHLNWNELDKRFFLIDTFSGLDEGLLTKSEIDTGLINKNEELLKNGFYTSDVESVRTNFKEWSSAIIVQGSIPNILKNVRTKEVAYLHLDLNCAYPEVEALNHFWKDMTPGGFVLLDDYGDLNHRNQKIEIDKWARPKGVEVLSIPTGQGLIIKPYS